MSDRPDPTPVPDPPAHPAPVDAAAAPTRPTPTAPSQREPVLDLLRGAALLGITLVNVQLMSGPAVYALFAGRSPSSPGPAGEVVRSLVNWLATGKFVSSFSILFGLGAALIAARATTGRDRRLLARRYGLLVAMGLLHMVLLFPGDVLFVYGISGFVLLAFVRVRARTALIWAVVLLAASTVALVGVTLASRAMPTDAFWLAEVTRQQASALEAYATGSVAGIIAANAWLAFWIQTDQVFALPWFLGLFLLGLSATRAGIVGDLAGHRDRLVRLARVTVPVGLVLNLPQILASPETMATGEASTAVAISGAVAYTAGAPVLAVGYLSMLAVIGLDRGTSTGLRRRLVALGRVALSGYLGQSVLAMLVFGGLRLYGQLGVFGELAVVAGIWLVLLLVAPWWTARYRFGPVEWVWRSLTYGRRQPMLRQADAAGTPASATRGSGRAGASLGAGQAVDVDSRNLLGEAGEGHDDRGEPGRGDR